MPEAQADPMTASCPGLTDAAFNKFVRQRRWSDASPVDISKPTTTTHPDVIASVVKSEEIRPAAAAKGAKKKQTHRRTVSDSELKHINFIQRYPAAAHAVTGKLMDKVSEEDSPDQVRLFFITSTLNQYVVRFISIDFSGEQDYPPSSPKMLVYDGPSFNQWVLDGPTQTGSGGGWDKATSQPVPGQLHCLRGL